MARDPNDKTTQDMGSNGNKLWKVTYSYAATDGGVRTHSIIVEGNSEEEARTKAQPVVAKARYPRITKVAVY